MSKKIFWKVNTKSCPTYVPSKITNAKSKLPTKTSIAAQEIRLLHNQWYGNHSLSQATTQIFIIHCSSFILDLETCWVTHLHTRLVLHSLTSISMLMRNLSRPRTLPTTAEDIRLIHEWIVQKPQFITSTHADIYNPLFFLFSQFRNLWSHPHTHATSSA